MEAVRAELAAAKARRQARNPMAGSELDGSNQGNDYQGRFGNYTFVTMNQNGADLP